MDTERSKKRAGFFERLTDSNSIFLFCLGCLFVVSCYYFFSWPISGGADTDLWYHLNGGRYFFAHKEPPDSGFFSFIAHDRYWANYYWLFQVTVYSVFSAFDYYGLIAFRSLLFLFSLGAIASFFLKDTRQKTAAVYFFAVTVLFFLALLPRYFAVVRPHMFSYLFIVVFICIFESRKKYWLYLLPVLAVVWVNVHGVEYPVLMLICFAYLADILVDRVKKRAPISRETLITIIPVLLALYAVFLTPFGVDLLFAPFKAASHQHLYIGEMQKPELSGFLNFNFTSVASSFTALSNLLIILVLISSAIGLFARKVKISHLLLFAGGLYLLLQANRFRYEVILLSLPLIRFHPLFFQELQSKKNGGFARFCIAVTILCVSLGFLHNVFRPRGNMPLTFENIPAGIVAFLKHAGAGGKILNDPNHGGYLQWELGEAYPIFMDLELMLFTDEDIYLAANAFLNQQVLAKVIARHKPGFIAPLIGNDRFKEVIRGFPDYTAVFFDDAAVLYVDKRQYPELADKYRLEALDPFHIAKANIASLPDDRAAKVLDELNTVYAIFPQGELVNQLKLLFARRQGNMAASQKHSDFLIENFPEKTLSYQLQGDLLFEKQKYEEAILSFEKALSLPGSSKSYAYKKISACFSKTGNSQKAYQAYKKGVKLYSAGTSGLEYYELGRLALMAGKINDGSMYLRFALYKTPEENTELTARINRLLLEAALKSNVPN